jgi:hypothetical protein
MTRRLGRWLLPRSLVPSREEHVPHKLTGEDVAGSLARFLASVILVVAIWSGLTLLGIKPIGKPPIVALVTALVFALGWAIFGLRQDLMGKRGIGWPGALVTAVAATTASLVASALAGGH